jgi:iron(III) transport system substrate-binding protein
MRLVNTFRLCLPAIFLLVGAISSAGAGNEELLMRAESLSGRAREEFLVAGAKREGEVADYTSTNHQMTGPLIKLFEKKYPFITVKLARIGGSQIIQRVETEAKAGLHAVDVMGTGELGIVSLVDRGVMGKYISPMRENLRPGFADKEGLWTVQHATLLFSAYNKKLVKADEVPRSWEDFLDPKWKGKLSLDTEAFEWMEFLINRMGEERALRYFERLTQQDVKFLRGRSLQLQLLAAGEFPITMVSNANLILDLKKAGAPIEPIRISPASTAELAFARRQCSPSPCRYALSRFFAVERRAKSAGKQRTSSVPKRRPDGRPRTAGGTEILHAGPPGIRQELQKAFGFI